MPEPIAQPSPEPISWHPPQALLEVAELVLTGALATAPAPVEVPETIGTGPVTLEDAEGTPVAGLSLADGAPRFEPRSPFTHGPVRAARRAPAAVREELGTDGAVLAVPVTTLLTAARVEEIRAGAQDSGHRLLWIAVTGAGRRLPLPADGLWRAVRDIAAEAVPGAPAAVAVPVAVPFLPDTDDPALLAAVARGYGATEVLVPITAASTAESAHRSARMSPEAGPTDPFGTDPARKLSAAPTGAFETEPAQTSTSKKTDPTRTASAELAGASGTEPASSGLFDVGPGELHPAFAREYTRAVPPPHRRGLTLFFTGLSGSGKSTVAKALAERLLDASTRTVSLLDGDEVRRMLSAGLTFSRADRDLNIRRIGYVAAEVTKHGGLAICAPIAPFEAVRAQVRDMVEEAGDFVLVHISTPLEECERRDRKGLYAKARRGEIPDFTGISSPYEVPADPELRIDTTGIPIDDAVDQVWALLTDRGYLAAPEK